MDEINNNQATETAAAEDVTSQSQDTSDIEKITTPEELQMIRIGEGADEVASQLDVYHINSPELANFPFVIAVDNDGDEDDGIILTATAEQVSGEDFKPEDFQVKLLGIAEKVLSPIAEEPVSEEPELGQAQGSLGNIDDTASIPSASDTAAIGLDTTKESQDNKVKVDLPEFSIDVMLDKIFGSDVDYEHTASEDFVMVKPEDVEKVKQMLDKIQKKGEVIEEADEAHFVVEDPENKEIKVVSKESMKSMFSKNPLIKSIIYKESMTDSEIVENLFREDETVTDSVGELEDASTPEEKMDVNLPSSSDEDETVEEITIDKNEDCSVRIKGYVYGLLVAFLGQEKADEIMEDIKTSKLDKDSPEYKVESLFSKLRDYVNLKESEEGQSLVNVEMISPDFKEVDVDGKAYGDMTLEVHNVFQDSEGGVKEETSKGATNKEESEKDKD